MDDKALKPKDYPHYTPTGPTYTVDKSDRHDIREILTLPLPDTLPNSQPYKLPPDHAATLSTTEAADRLGVTPMTVSRLWREGHLQGYKLTPGKRNSPLRIYTETVEKLLNQRQHK